MPPKIVLAMEFLPRRRTAIVRTMERLERAKQVPVLRMLMSLEIKLKPEFRGAIRAHKAMIVYAIVVSR
jgi:hypothetical protein